MLTPNSRTNTLRDREDKKVGKEVLLHRKKTKIADSDFSNLAANQLQPEQEIIEEEIIEEEDEETMPVQKLVELELRR